jgi:DNA-binding LacI/PurR family transcriptional regulator
VDRHLVVQGHFDIASGRNAMQQLLSRDPRPTAVFAGNDPMAIGAIYACRDAGLAIPGDISIVGAGNIEGVHHPFPFLTTVDWPRHDLGRTAASFLIEAIIHSEGEQSRVCVFEPTLLRRQSAGPAG